MCVFQKVLRGFLILFLSYAIIPVSYAQLHHPFVEVEIESPYREVLLEDPDFMREGGARLLASQSGERMLIGISKVFYEPGRTMQEMKRIGEIQSRAAILELGGDVEISTMRKGGGEQASVAGQGKTVALSSFFQTAEVKVEGRIRQLPVIGTWWTSHRNCFYVAVGAVMDEECVPVSVGGEETIPSDGPVIDGEEPFVTLLRTFPVLCRQGGCRAFAVDDGRRILIAVGAAEIKGAWNKARRVAKIKALREILGQKGGLYLTSVQSLVDREQVILSTEREARISLSEFMEVQAEEASGLVRMSPVVASWQSADETVLYVAIGQVFESRK